MTYDETFEVYWINEQINDQLWTLAVLSNISKTFCCNISVSNLEF